jgi:hypothetical protein
MVVYQFLSEEALASAARLVDGTVCFRRKRHRVRFLSALFAIFEQEMADLSAEREAEFLARVRRHAACQQ